MFEKVNPSHPDKVADRIAGAIVDLAYEKSEEDPKIAVEVLVGHGKCHIIAETSNKLSVSEINKIVKRIAKEDLEVDYAEVPQDPHLAENQEKGFRCGDNGIFKGIPVSQEEKYLSSIARDIYSKYPYDGKYIYDDEHKNLIVCQSNANSVTLLNYLTARYCDIKGFKINPLGDWTGGTGVDCGACNRKLGSDMARAVTGGGIIGKDVSKADVSVNIYCHILAQKYNAEVTAYCAIGDTDVTITIHTEEPIVRTEKFEIIVDKAKEYIAGLGGFEKLAEWGLI